MVFCAASASPNMAPAFTTASPIRDGWSNWSARASTTIKPSAAPAQQFLGITDVNSGASLVHVAWITSHPRLLGTWYGTEIVLADTYVDTGGHGIGLKPSHSERDPLSCELLSTLIFSRATYYFRCSTLERTR
jgi:hypothetical protein